LELKIRPAARSKNVLPSSSSNSDAIYLCNARSYDVDQNSAGGAIEDDEVYTPPVAIVLCLKGAEESLADCLTGLISQDYPDFQLNIVIHSPTDPAAESVQNFFANLKQKPQIHFLENPESTCSLKCSAICQAIEALSTRIEVVAFVDGDAVVDESWLNDLVTPLSDSGIGVTTGNRWYSPTEIQMQRYEIAWGGSLAIRKDVIDRCGLLAKWRTTFCEDTPLTNVLREQKLHLYRVPDLIIENKESVSLLGAFNWISRQLLTVRLHHPAWSLVLLHGIVTGIASIVAPVLMVLLFWWGMTADGVTLLKTILVYQAANFVLLFLIGRSNRRAINRRDSYNGLEVVKDKNWKMHFFSTLVTQLVQPFAIWQANSMEKVNWRRAIYRVKDGTKIKLLRVKKDRKTQPAVVTQTNADASTSDSERHFR